MGTVALPISGLVNVQVNLADAATQAQNTTSLLILTNNAVIDTETRLMAFPSLAAVGQTFGTAGIEYAAATPWFGQNPSPTELLIGRWAKTASAGQLVCGALTTLEQVMSLWQAVVAGTFNISINGAPAVLVEAMDFSGTTNLNGVASAIDAAIVGAGLAARCVWNGNQFVFTAGTSGSTSTISPMIADVVPTDICVMLHSTVDGGAKSINGIDAESISDAVNLFDLNFGYTWYGLVIPEASDADHLTVAAQVQGFSDTKHFYGITTYDPAALDILNTTDLAFQLSRMELNRTAVQWSSTSPYAVISTLARIMTTDYNQNSSVITLMYKQNPGITAEQLNRTQLNSLLTKNCNVFVAYAGNALIIQPGTTCTTNQFIDTIMGLDNLAIDLQNALFNVLYTTPTKIPQTDAGMNMLTNAAEAILVQYVTDGLMAPGVWSGAAFGALSTGDYMDKGYYIYCPPIALQSTADRAARMAGPMTVAVKLAGAVHTVDATIFVNP